jgi:hypothetical protein
MTDEDFLNGQHKSYHSNSTDLISSTTEAILPASREQSLRIRKREGRKRENLLVDEINAMFGPTWKEELD